MMHLLGIGTEIEASGHLGKVVEIRSVPSNMASGRMPVVVVKLHDQNRIVSVLGVDIEKVL